jgi:hypothetical protein
MQYFHRLYESWNGSMETWEKSVVVKHVGKGVIVDSKKQMYKWVYMAKTLQWKCDGEIPIIMSINTFKYTERYSNTFKYIDIHWNILWIHSSIFKCIQLHSNML